MRGHFKAQSQNDCFVHLDGFKKGCVYINGFNIGRYWEIGPQRALYIPGVLLKDENEIIILELEGCEKAEVEITAEPDLGKGIYIKDKTPGCKIQSGVSLFKIRFTALRRYRTSRAP